MHFFSSLKFCSEKSGSIDIESEEADPVKKSYTSYSYDEQDYSIINRKTTSDPVKDDLEYDLVENNNTKDSAMQTPRTVAMQVIIPFRGGGGMYWRRFEEMVLRG